MSGKEGTVFILTNDAMPGFVRLDFTTKDDVTARIRKVNRSELPVPYRVEYAARVPDCEALERSLRFVFSDFCEERGSNFFKINPDLLRAAIEPAAIATVELDDEELGIEPDMRTKMDQLSAYHDALRFEALKLEPGTALNFVKDPSLTCTVIGNGMVEFEGNAATPAEASVKAMQKLGFEWDRVSATDYWVPETPHFPKGQSSKANKPGMDSVLTRMPEPADDVGNSPVMFIRNNKI